MRSLILVAAGGLAREALAMVRAGGAYEAVGFLDDDAALWGTALADLPVLGGLDELARHPDASVLICAGHGESREAIAARLGLPDSRYATVIDSSVTVPASCRIGVGAVLMAGCVLTADVSVGRHVVCMPDCVITHDDVVDDYATLCAGVTLGGYVQVASRAYVGMRASIRERCRIGADALVGMGAVVLGDVPDGQTWYGVPAAPAPLRVDAHVTSGDLS